MLTFEQIKELIEIVTRQRLQCVEIERSGFRLRIDGRAGGAGEAAPPPHRLVEALPAPGGEAVSPAEKPETPVEEIAPGEAAALKGLHVLHSPIVGTFFEAPNPEADPFVAVGDRVKAGQVLCIVEAMKLMNEIEADASGILREVYPKNAQPVEFGEPLFAIDPD